jgi:hypothetical protein
MARAGQIKPAPGNTVAPENEPALALYDKLSTTPGPVNDALDAAAQSIARGENGDAAKERAYQQIKAVLLARLAGEG